MTIVNARNQDVVGSPGDAAVTERPAAKTVVYRSEGQRLLCDVPGSLNTIAKSVGASKQSVAWWRSGEKMPGDGFRTTIEKIYGISARLWDKAPIKPGAPANDGSIPPKAHSTTSSEDYADLIEVCQELLRTGGLKPSDRLKAVAEVRALRSQLDRQQRHAKKMVTDREIVRSVAWVQIREALGTALKPHPEALAAVVDAIKKLDL